MAAAWAILSGQNTAAPIHFTYRPIGFRLESCETPRRHAPETMAGGVAVFDYNNDGYLDIFFANGADIESLKKTSPKYANHLFENDGKGHFTDVTAKTGLAGTGFDNGVAIGDYDNDGREDIFVGGVHGNHLYHNDGGKFTDVTIKAGLGAADPQYGPLWSVGGAWVDINNDGFLDLIVVNYLAWDPNKEPSCEVAPGKLDYCHPKLYKPTPNQLFLNNRDGTFHDISEESGIRSHPGKGMGIGVADYDQDGLMDFFISNDKMNNSLFHSKGGARFEEIAFQAGVALLEDGKLISGMGVDARDIDN
ncbi:MAG TPA: VCBS repeat-containing protein, partial [Bryobacteraceae bacterium]